MADGVSKKKETLCIHCGNACGGCSWSDSLTPVEGWTAEETVGYDGIRSWRVIDCPEKAPDRRLDPKGIPESSIHALAAAVVEQAVSDYRYCIRGRTLSGERNKGGRHQNMDELREKACEGSMKSIERFFRSDWFYTLCDCDGEAVIKYLRQERYLHRVKKAMVRMGL